MSSHLTFLLLGLGPGSVIAALAVGLVITHRATGVVNFAAAAVGVFVALAYYEFRGTGDLVLPVLGGPSRVHLLARPTVSTALGVVLAYSALLGAAAYWLVIRPLRNAPRLAGTVATLGMLLYAIAIADARFARRSGDLLVLDGPLPDRVLTLGSIATPADRLILGCAIVAGAALCGQFYRRTRFGLATRGLADNRKGGILLGISPDMIGMANWAVSSAMSALILILAAPIVRLEPATTGLLVVPALAAALAGRFDRIAVAAAAGLALGMAQSEILNLQADWQWLPNVGLQQGLPFLAVLAIVAIRSSRPAGRETEVTLLPRVPGSTGGPRVVVVVAGLCLLVMMLGTSPWRSAVIVSAIGVVFGLSVVTVSGLTGQVSVATHALAGCAAFGLVRLGESAGLGFPFGALVAIAGTTALGVLLGIISSGSKGTSLTIATLAAAVAIEELVFRWRGFSGGLAGANVDRPAVLGIDLGISAAGGAYPRPVFGVGVIIVAVVAALGVLRIRRSPVARRWLAVRSNERAARSVGVSVTRVKLEAFGVSSFLAGLGGVLLAYRSEIVTVGSFRVLDAIVVLALASLAGLGAPMGALIVGALTNGGLVTQALDAMGADPSSHQLAVTGLALMVTAVRLPHGVLGRSRPSD